MWGRHRTAEREQDEPRLDENVRHQVPDNDRHQAAAADDIRDRIENTEYGGGCHGAKGGGPIDFRCKKPPAYMRNAEKNARGDYLKRGTEAGPSQFAHYEAAKVTQR